MSCPKTQHILQEYFADNLASLAKEKIESHLLVCGHCSNELESLLLTQSTLNQWKNERAPHWNRGMELFRREHQTPISGFSLWHRLQWAPTIACFVMMIVLLLNVNFVSSQEGFSVSFGSTSDDSPAIEERLVAFQEEQRLAMDTLAGRIEDRQSSNNIELLQTVLDQNQQTTAENLNRIYAFFEQQRLRDLEDMRVGYQDLVDNDYETIRSLQQLAQFVSFQSPER
ncbi:MAG: hypothetical protein ACJZ8R_00625 [Pseudohongiellaceae bacterium]|uniref:Zinc-finger domain-containing protein n=1 Tax=OM182 bacterium MED-G28 TaxID=1986256 RepID=A0A2A5WA98_9GAMM|nr:hypothetical protein [Gammaproteobacteria bacterium]PDH33223.1 MAG: hypothetical protein CNF02_09750 [OM182 bacterium MED-G28]